MLEKAGVILALFYHKDTKRCVQWYTNIANANSMLRYADSLTILRNFLHKGWEIKEREDIKGNEIERKIKYLFALQQMRDKELQAKNYKGEKS